MIIVVYAYSKDWANGIVTQVVKCYHSATEMLQMFDPEHKDCISV